ARLLGRRPGTEVRMTSGVALAPYVADFTVWLREQRHRDDHVGHLADDCYHDRDWPSCDTLDGFEDYLWRCNAIREAVDALRRAWAEWSQPPEPPPVAPPPEPAPAPRYPPPRRPRHLTGDRAWEAYVALGGDGLAAN